ncbi:DUF2807 domain-containing protein [Algibacter sp. 2305UL17-15]|uniref:GIN domain-containing protein n=1 Tax=Algibacter sp. 2305UL17-15 TaxID=3231268 RepID=UPI00345ACC42
MKTNHLFYLILTLSLTLASCSLDVVIASDDIISEERVLSNFDEIDVSSDMEVIIKQGLTQSVKVTTSNNLQNKVTTRVNNRKLTARINGSITRLKVLRLEITMPTITRLELSADSFGTLSGFENLDTFRLKVSSDASIDLTSGSAKSMTIEASSDAKIEGFDFKVNTCNVNCSSDASISITCLDALSGSVSSDGVLFYKGNPRINVTTSSDGAVINSN